MKRYIAVFAIVAVLALAAMTACVSQNTLAALVTTLGNASAGIAALEGNSSLAATLKADTAAAAADVLNWQKGSDSQMVVEALGIVEADLNLIPYVAPYSALIDIAIATVDEIITEVTGASSAPVNGAIRAGNRHIALTGSTPRDPKHFKSEWNKVAQSDSRLEKLVIQ